MTRKTTTVTETFKDGELVSRVTETKEETEEGEVRHHHYHHGSSGGYGAQPYVSYGDPYCYGGTGGATSGGTGGNVPSWDDIVACMKNG